MLRNQFFFVELRFKILFFYFILPIADMVSLWNFVVVINNDFLDFFLNFIRLFMKQIRSSLWVEIFLFKKFFRLSNFSSIVFFIVLI